MLICDSCQSPGKEADTIVLSLGKAGEPVLDIEDAMDLCEDCYNHFRALVENVPATLDKECEQEWPT